MESASSRTPLPPQPLTVFPVMVVSLRVGENGLDGLLGNVETLYGDPADPFTVHRLVPRAAVVIRIGAQCEVIHARATKAGPSDPTRVIVRASVRLTREMSEGGVWIDSEPTTVTVSPK